MASRGTGMERAFSRFFGWRFPGCCPGLGWGRALPPAIRGQVRWLFQRLHYSKRARHGTDRHTERRTEILADDSETGLEIELHSRGIAGAHLQAGLLESGRFALLEATVEKRPGEPAPAVVWFEGDCLNVPIVLPNRCSIPVHNGGQALPEGLSLVGATGLNKRHGVCTMPGSVFITRPGNRCSGGQTVHPQNGCLCARKCRMVPHHPCLQAGLGGFRAIEYPREQFRFRVQNPGCEAIPQGVQIRGRPGVRKQQGWELCGLGVIRHGGGFAMDGGNRKNKGNFRW